MREPTRALGLMQLCISPLFGPHLGLPLFDWPDLPIYSLSSLSPSGVRPVVLPPPRAIVGLLFFFGLRPLFGPLWHPS